MSDEYGSNQTVASPLLIQGPPGTGKSFTDEAIIEVLLANKVKAVWVQSFASAKQTTLCISY